LLKRCTNPIASSFSTKKENAGKESIKGTWGRTFVEDEAEGNEREKSHHQTIDRKRPAFSSRRGKKETSDVLYNKGWETVISRRGTLLLCRKGECASPVSRGQQEHIGGCVRKNKLENVSRTEMCLPKKKREPGTLHFRREGRGETFSYWVMRRSRWIYDKVRERKGLEGDRKKKYRDQGKRSIRGRGWHSERSGARKGGKES